MAVGGEEDGKGDGNGNEDDDYGGDRSVCRLVMERY